MCLDLIKLQCSASSSSTIPIIDSRTKDGKIWRAIINNPLNTQQTPTMAVALYVGHFSLCDADVRPLSDYTYHSTGVCSSDPSFVVEINSTYGCCILNIFVLAYEMELRF